jgi:hypothetical protein
LANVTLPFGRQSSDCASLCDAGSAAKKRFDLKPNPTSLNLGLANVRIAQTLGKTKAQDFQPTFQRPHARMEQRRPRPSSPELPTRWQLMPNRRPIFARKRTQPDLLNTPPFD